MKKIKFRAWDSDQNKMIFTFDEYKIMVNDEEGTLFCGGHLPNGDWNEPKLMQYTGLKDKNGKEIYEGDILKFFDKPIAVVEWMEFGGWAYRWIDEVYKRVRQRNPEPFFHNINLWEVIGNIYQDKHLLE